MWWQVGEAESVSVGEEVGEVVGMCRCARRDGRGGGELEGMSEACRAKQWARRGGRVGGRGGGRGGVRGVAFLCAVASVAHSNAFLAIHLGTDQRIEDVNSVRLSSEASAISGLVRRQCIQCIQHDSSKASEQAT